MNQLLNDIRQCTHCAAHLPLGPRPVVQAHTKSNIIIIGQAPGSKVHANGIPWSDASGDELRRWLAVDKETFYNEEIFATVPMGFCYPGKGPSGDKPPRAECAPLWHKKILDKAANVQLILLIGQYSQNYYLQERMGPTLTDTVKNFKRYLPQFMPLPHPSPRNRIWLKKNPWFEKINLPLLRKTIKENIG